MEQLPNMPQPPSTRTEDRAHAVASYRGCYVEETPGRVRTITDVDTSVTVSVTIDAKLIMIAGSPGAWANNYKIETKQSSIDAARFALSIVVGFAPLKPAEFVVIKIQQKAGHENHGSVQCQPPAIRSEQ